NRDARLEALCLSLYRAPRRAFYWPAGVARQTATRTQRRGSSIVSRTAPPWRQAAQADRQAFDRALAPTYPELLQAAQRELRHRLTLGQFAPDNPTPEQLLDMALQRVWRERRRLASTLGIKAFALAPIFRTAEALAGREDERSRTTTELFPEEVEHDPLHERGEALKCNLRFGAGISNCAISAVCGALPLKVSTLPSAEITTRSPSLTSPARIISASGSCTLRWITRFRGLAP